ncbi:MAG: hypothetical protein HYY18_10025 [Planctomycetes bacterium]|nr:hypothetical protein [Planctomycetota bacterium]
MIDLTALMLLLAALSAAPADAPALFVDRIDVAAGTVHSIRAFRTEDGFVLWAGDEGMKFRRKGKEGGFEFFTENGKEEDFVALEMKEVLEKVAGDWEKRAVKIKEREFSFVKRDDHVYVTSKEEGVWVVRPGRLETHRGKLEVREAPGTKSVESYRGDLIRITGEDGKAVDLRESAAAKLEDLKKLGGKTVEVAGYFDVGEFPGNHGQAYPQDPSGEPVERPRRLVISTIRTIE